MRISHVLTAALALSTVGSVAAHADTFTFSFGTSANKFSGSGTLSGSEVSSGIYSITDATGSVMTTANNTPSVVSVEGINGFQGNDNLLYVSSAGDGTFDIFGLSLLLSNNAQVNLYTNLLGDHEILERAGGAIVSESANYTVTRAVAATPEPGSFLLLGTGLLGGIGAMRRRLFA